MHVLYDENGDFKLGTILAETEGSLQVESQHGRRTKVKASHALLRFASPAPAEMQQAAGGLVADIDPAFLWEACGDEEFGFVDLAREYFGASASPAQSMATLLALHQAPVYFHRKGRGRYRRAPAEILAAALASLEKKRLQQLQINAWVESLIEFRLPAELRAVQPMLLYKPDRNRPETKAFEEACLKTGLSGAHLIERCGGLPSSHDYHLQGFLHEHFPEGIALPADLPCRVPDDLEVAPVRAFSIDDADTTEIDDAFSLTRREDGTLRIGIHIAAPALGFEPDSPAGVIARRRLSTVYLPGDKITMLPPTVIAAYTLAEGQTCPALSLYVDVDPADWVIRQTHSCVEAVPIVANLRHQAIAHLNQRLEAGEDVSDEPFGGELMLLHAFASALAIGRGETERNFDRQEYGFQVIEDRVLITERRRGAPLDKLVAELMILANATWGEFLCDHEVAGIYRVQSQSKVRMTTTPGPHEGLGVPYYAWSSSPLRRYVDLINQWQLVSLVEGRSPPFDRQSASVMGAIRDFELTYAAYGEFQGRMENYWCLRWLLQEARPFYPATVVRENLVKIDEIPYFLRLPSLPPERGPGDAILLEVRGVDLIDSTLDAVYKNPLSV
jgi:exoribonuclease-2